MPIVVSLFCCIRRKHFLLGQAPPACVSVNNGVFLCVDCEAIHTKLGPEISHILPLTLNEWKEPANFQYLKLGGNERLNMFLRPFNLDKKPGNIKYRSKAAAFYRRQLDALVNNRPFEEKPLSHTEGREDYLYAAPHLGGLFPL